MAISIRTIATIAVAAFLGVVAVILTRGYLNTATQGGSPTAPAASVQIVVAAQALDRGAVLQPTALRVVSFPADAAPANAFHSIAELTGGKDQQRLALRSMVVNEPILAPNVSGPGGKLNLSGTVAEGMRAVSIRSTDVTGVGGFVLPGDRVDVLLTRADASSTVTQVLAENVRVLGVDQSANDEADKPVVSKAITVETTPEQAQTISLAQAVGTISLTLRHVADDTPLTRKSTAVADLAVGQRKASAGPRSPMIRVIRGTDASQVSLDGSGVTAAASGFTSNVASGLGRAAAQAPAGVATP